jgi:hypothetical protein
MTSPAGTPAQVDRALSTVDRTAVAVLLAIAGFCSIWLLYRIGMVVEFDRNEAWNAWHADALRLTGKLYPASGDIIANNYPPLSFYVLAAASGLGADTIIAGRVLSVLSALLATFSVAVAISRLGGSRTAVLFGAAWYIAVMVRCYWDYVGMNDPTLFGFSLMVAALAWFLSRLAADRSPLPALIAMVVAGFVKHNMIAIPVTAILWLLLQDWRSGLRYAVLAAAAAAMGLLACRIHFGPEFIEQLMMPRDVSLLRTWRVFARLQWVLPALVLWALWANANRDRSSVRFTALFIAVATVSATIQQQGSGVNKNYMFELVAATAIGTGLAFASLPGLEWVRRMGVARAKAIAATALVVRMLADYNFEPALVVFSPSYRSEITAREAVMRREIERVGPMAEPVSCSILTACYRAGKRFSYDDFAMTQWLMTKRITPAELRARLGERNVRMVEIDPKARWREPRSAFKPWLPHRWTENWID